MRAGARARLEQHLNRAWVARGPLTRALWPLSQLYRAGMALRHALYRWHVLNAERLPEPVIVVGNLIAGGAGKTPATLAVVEHLRARGWRPGIVSRGYGRTTTDVRVVAADADPRAVGDEPLLLRQRAKVPVAVGRQRAAAGRALLATHPEVDILVCDDGLQHLALARDIEIAVFDARGLGNGWLLPAGPLREAWPRPVDALLWTETPAAQGPTGFTARRRLADHARRADGATLPLATLQSAPLTAVAGIARPEAFFALLRQAGLPLAATVALPDHYDFNSMPRSLNKGHALICTEKDAAKLWRHRPDALAVPLELDVPAAFFSLLDERLAARGYHPRKPA